MKKRKCLICGYKWKRIFVNNPKSCPKCRSKLWDYEIRGECMICKRHFLDLHIHHLDGNHLNNIKINTIYICGSCHKKIHLGLGKTTKFLKYKQTKTTKERLQKINHLREIWLNEKYYKKESKM